MNIVFDFDGTLLDSRQRHVLVLKKSMDLLGLKQYCIDDYLNYKADGHSTKMYLLNCIKMDELAATQVCNIWTSLIENKDFLKYDCLYNDTISVLEECANAGHELYLLSARQSKEYLMWQLSSQKLTDFFKKIICVSPSNARLQKTICLREIKAEYIVGDTEVDFLAAREVGINSYVLNRGFRSEKYWNEQGVASYATLADLKQLLNIACRKKEKS